MLQNTLQPLEEKVPIPTKMFKDAYRRLKDPFACTDGRNPEIEKYHMRVLQKYRWYLPYFIMVSENEICIRTAFYVSKLHQLLFGIWCPIIIDVSYERHSMINVLLCHEGTWQTAAKHVI